MVPWKVCTQQPTPPLPPLSHPLMELGDEPQFSLQVTPSFLCSDVPQNVFMPHTWCNEHISLVLPRLLILSERGRRGRGRKGGRGDVKLFLDIKTTHWGAISKKASWVWTWMGKTLTATYSFIIWAFQTQPKRPLAFTSSNCRGLRPSRGEAGGGPGSWRTKRGEQGLISSLKLQIQK